jgi:hypothetical protein
VGGKVINRKKDRKQICYILLFEKIATVFCSYAITVQDKSVLSPCISQILAKGHNGGFEISDRI